MFCYWFHLHFTEHGIFRTIDTLKMRKQMSGNMRQNMASKNKHKLSEPQKT